MPFLCDLAGIAFAQGLARVLDRLGQETASGDVFQHS